MENNKGCKYCMVYGKNDAWMSQPILETNKIESNIYGNLSSDDVNRHKGITVKIKDYGHCINLEKDNPKYIQHILNNPAALEIRSEYIGKKLFPVFDDYPMIIEIGINYCPNCGRKLGIN